MHARLLIAARRREEAGAIGALFAVLLATGVLFGAIALTLDYGMLNGNHSQLQSSADAAALQAARLCATSLDGSCPGADSLTAISQANDGGSARSSSVLDICGRDAAASLPACDHEDDANITACPQTSWAGTYVEVRTTKQTDEVFTNNGEGGSQQGAACAAVAWGNAGSVTGVLPVTVPSCVFNGLTANGTDYSSTQVVAIAINEAAKGNCMQAPTGNSGWLSAESANCRSVVATIGIGNPGEGSANSCLQSFTPGGTYFLPVWSSVVPDTHGSNGSYIIAGVAAFHLTGLNAPGAASGGITFGDTTAPGCPKVGVSPPQPASNGNNPCIWGYFTSGVTALGSIDTSGNAPDTGLNIIQTIG